MIGVDRCNARKACRLIERHIQAEHCAHRRVKRVSSLAHDPESRLRCPQPPGRCHHDPKTQAPSLSCTDRQIPLSPVSPRADTAGTGTVEEQLNTVRMICLLRFRIRRRLLDAVDAKQNQCAAEQACRRERLMQEHCSGKNGDRCCQIGKHRSPCDRQSRENIA